MAGLSTMEVGEFLRFFFLSPRSCFFPLQGSCGAAGKPLSSSSSCVRWGGTRREEEDGCASMAVHARAARRHPDSCSRNNVL